MGTQISVQYRHDRFRHVLLLELDARMLEFIYVENSPPAIRAESFPPTLSAGLASIEFTARLMTIAAISVLATVVLWHSYGRLEGDTFAAVRML